MDKLLATAVGFAVVLLVVAIPVYWEWRAIRKQRASNRQKLSNYKDLIDQCLREERQNQTN